MCKYKNVCDDYYVNLNLNTEMILPANRDTVLHHFEQLKKKYPTMRNFYSRDKSEFVLEEDKSNRSYRWSSIEEKRVSSGFFNPPSFEEAIEQHLDVLDAIPYSLSMSPLDCEALNLVYGFDFNYRGNHHNLLAETFGMAPVLDQFKTVSGGSLLSFDPTIQIALDEDCRTQCRLNIESRTSAYQVRTNEFHEEPVSVFMTIRRYGSLDSGETYHAAFKKLINWGELLLDSHVLTNILMPLRQAIAIK